MLSKANRLTTKEFDEIMKKGRVIHSSLFLFRYTTGHTGTKISAVGPQKIAKLAVERNKIRRTIYRVLDPFMVRMVTGFHGVILAKTNLDAVTDEAIHADIEDLLKKAGVLV